MPRRAESVRSLEEEELFTPVDKPHVVCFLPKDAAEIDDFVTAVHLLAENGFTTVQFHVETLRDAGLAAQIGRHLFHAIRSAWVTIFDAHESGMDAIDPSFRRAVFHHPASWNGSFSKYLGCLAGNEQELPLALPALHIYRSRIERLSSELTMIQEHRFPAALLWPAWGLRGWECDPVEDRLSLEDYDRLQEICAPFGGSAGPLKILLRPGILPTRLLLEHPCNAYACRGGSCHGGRTGFPRRLVVDAQGLLWPETHKLAPFYCLGNIYEGAVQRLLSAGPDARHPFHDLCARTYEQFVVQNPCFYTPLHDVWSHLAETEALSG